MRKSSLFWYQKSKKISGEGHNPLPRLHPQWGGGHPLPTPPRRFYTSTTFSGDGAQPPPETPTSSGEGDTPSPHLTPPRRPRFSRLRRSTSAPRSSRLCSDKYYLFYALLSTPTTTTTDKIYQNNRDLASVTGSQHGVSYSPVWGSVVGRVSSQTDVCLSKVNNNRIILNRECIQEGCQKGREPVTADRPLLSTIIVGYTTSRWQTARCWFVQLLRYGMTFCQYM